MYVHIYVCIYRWQCFLRRVRRENEEEHLCLPGGDRRLRLVMRRKDTAYHYLSLYTGIYIYIYVGCRCVHLHHCCVQEGLSLLVIITRRRFWYEFFFFLLLFIWTRLFCLVFGMMEATCVELLSTVQLVLLTSTDNNRRAGHWGFLSSSLYAYYYWRWCGWYMWLYTCIYIYI